ncbi:hypothetical protein ACFL0V_07355, partial [Nanoarchaeota archaeon]
IYRILRQSSTPRFTGIALSDLGKTHACLYFAERFFTRPWRGSKDRNGDGKITLSEAARSAYDDINTPRVKSKLTLTGDFDPRVELVAEAGRHFDSRSTSGVWIPSGMMYGTTVTRKEELYKHRGVVVIKDAAAARQAMADPNGRFLYMLDGCGACELLAQYVLDELPKRPANQMYVLALSECKKHKGKHHRIGKHGAAVHKYLRSKGSKIKGGAPVLLKLEGGKLTYSKLGLPTRTYTHGDLTDKSIEGFDKKALRQFLA